MIKKALMLSICLVLAFAAPTFAQEEPSLQSLTETNKAMELKISELEAETQYKTEEINNLMSILENERMEHRDQVEMLSIDFSDEIRQASIDYEIQTDSLQMANMGLQERIYELEREIDISREDSEIRINDLVKKNAEKLKEIIRLEGVVQSQRDQLNNAENRRNEVLELMEENQSLVEELERLKQQ